MSAVTARRYGAVLAINLVIGVVGAVLPTFASTPSHVLVAGTTHPTRMERRVEHTRIELIRNGGFHHGRADWKASGRDPRVKIIHPGLRSGHAARVVGAKPHRAAAGIAEHLSMVPAESGDRFVASAMVRRVGHRHTNVWLRITEMVAGQQVGHYDRRVALRGRHWHRLGINYTDRRSGSRLVLSLMAPSAQHRHGFIVDRVRVIQTRRIVIVPVPVGNPDPTPTPTPSSSSPTPTPSSDSPTPGPSSASPTPSSASPTPTPTPTATSASPTPSPSATPSATPTVPAPPVSPSASCSLSKMMVPSCGVLWGAYRPLQSGETWTTDTTDLESQVGRKFDIVYRYHDFSTSGAGVFPDANEQALAASGRVLLDDWAPRIFSTGVQLKWADVADGTYDSTVIDPEAERIKAYGKPIMLSFDHEMDARVGTSGTAADYVAAYRHIEDTFNSLGVTNVIWVWTITGYSGHNSEFQSLYPGSSYVDWIGYDPYNFGSCKSEGWKTFSQTIDPEYQWLESNGFGNKPFILPEYGTVPDPSDSSAAATWYSSIPSVLASHPNIKALVTWDDQVGSCNTQLTASPGELAAFASAGLAPSLQSASN
jgi:hypothetical protein